MANDSNLTIRVPAEMRDRFLQVCKAKDVTASQILRAAMRDFLERNPQPSLPLGPALKGRKAKGKRNA